MLQFLLLCNGDIIRIELNPRLYSLAQISYSLWDKTEVNNFDVTHPLISSFAAFNIFFGLYLVLVCTYVYALATLAVTPS